MNTNISILQNPSSVFSVMSKIAIESNAIDMSTGFPFFDCAPEILNIISTYLKKGYSQYTPSEGIFPLREIITKRINDAFKIQYNPESEIIVSAGFTEALFASIASIVKEDDEVVIFEPAYSHYTPLIAMHGGRPVYISLKEPDFKIDWKEVEKSVHTRTRMIIINNPSNPTGAVFSADDLEKLQKITSKSKIVVLADETMRHMVSPETQTTSILQFPELAQRSIVISSFGEINSMIGWELGYILANKSLMADVQKTHQFIVTSVNTPTQFAINDYFRNHEIADLKEFYQNKKQIFLNSLKNSKFIPLLSQGSFFQLLDYSQISKEKDIDMAIRITKEFGVSCIPLSPFYHETVNLKLLRFCFARPDQLLVKAGESLSKM